MAVSTRLAHSLRGKAVSGNPVHEHDLRMAWDLSANGVMERRPGSRWPRRMLERGDTDMLMADSVSLETVKTLREDTMLEPCRRVSQRGDRGLGPVPPRARYRRPLRRLGLFWCCATRRVYSPAVRDRRWTGKRPRSSAHSGQHDPGQHQALLAWHLPPHQLEASAALPCRVLLPVQPTLLDARDVPPTRIRRPANTSHALPSPEAG